MPRRALLIGIDNYLDDELVLVAPKNDVNEFARVLSRVGYPTQAIQRLIGSDGAALSTNALRNHIQTFFAAAKPDDDLLLVISGHGIEQGEHRLILPNDYYLVDPPPPAYLVQDQFFYGEALKSEARSIIILIDACREAKRFSLVTDKGAPESEPARYANAPSVAILYSCARDELSRADGNPGGLSFFTAACCAVLDGDNEIAVLEDFREVVNKKLSARFATRRDLLQTATFGERPIAGRGGSPERLLIKENHAARIRQRIADSRWCRDLTSAPLWSKLLHGWPAAAAQAQWIVLNAEDLVEQAATKLTGNDWRDERAPGRVLDRLRILLRDQTEVLSVSEIAVALVSPFVYEGVLAAGELLLAQQGDPLKLQQQTLAGRPWLAWQSAIAAEEAFKRRAALLRTQGLESAATDLVAWQLVRFLQASGELWEYTAKEAKNSVGWASDLLHSWFEPAPFDDVAADTYVCRLLSGHRLVKLARLAFATPDDIAVERSEGKDGRLQNDLLIGPAYLDRRVNELLLAHLLNMAFALATDARRLSSLFAEHLGRPTLITARFLQQTLDEISWNWNMQGGTLAAALDCPHEVVDQALADAVEALNRHRLSLNQTADFPEAVREILPSFFSASAVRASVGPDGTPVYQVPHLRLTLDHARIREILMGEQLYGRPELALREMYQNALDACRYRRARVQYLRSMGRRIDEYVGRIEFRAGVEDGRTYIECRDDGIGMGERHLRNLFARAGSRFTDSHEFHLERARWAEQGIKFWPNSRFGIGVFSYFMLADEVRVETRRLREDGCSCELGLILTVVGSGSLFRVQRNDDIAPGTVVRVYLNHSKYAGTMTKSICQWLWQPELETLLVDVDGNSMRLDAGQPSSAMIESAGPLVAVPESAGHNGQPRLFWKIPVPDRGAGGARPPTVLVDGIWTEIPEYDDGLLSDGVVLNLTEDLRPDLSVDRQQVKDLRAASEWLAAQICAGAYSYILHAPNLRLLDLDEAFLRRPMALVYLDRDLREGKLRTHASIDGQQSVQLAGLGLSPTLDRFASELWLIQNVRERYSEEFRNRQSRSVVMCRVAARVRAIADALSDAPLSLRRLAAFARHNQWQDEPSLDLAIEGAARLPMGDCGDAVVAEWFRFYESSIFYGDTPDVDALVALETFIAGVITVSPAHIALAVLGSGKSLLEVLHVIRRVRGQEFRLRDLQRLQRALPESWRSFTLLSPEYLRSTSWMKEDDKRDVARFARKILDTDEFQAELPRQLSVRYLLFAAHELNLTLGAVVELAKPLAAWGINVQDVSGLAPELLESVRVPRMFWISEKPTFGTGVSVRLLDCAASAQDADITPADVARLLVPFRQFGIAVPDPATVPAQPLSELSLRLVTAPFIGSSKLAVKISLRNLVVASLSWDLPLDTVIAAARPLRVWGVELPDLDRLPSGLIPKKYLNDLLLKRGGTLLPISSLVTTVEGGVQSLDQLLDTVRPWADLLFNQQLPPTPFEMDERLKSLQSTQVPLGWTDAISAWDLAATAHRHGDDPASYIRALDQLAQFGVNIGEAKAFAQFCQNQS